MKSRIFLFQTILQIMVLLASFAIIVSLSLEIFYFSKYGFSRSFVEFQFWVCIFFLFDFFVGLWSSSNRKKYFYTHFLFFLISIPYLSLISYFQVSLSNEVYYCIRFIPIIRGGYALVMVVNWFTKSKMSNLFISYLLSLMTVIYFSSLIFYDVERPVNELVQDYKTALWWAFMDATTVGSNIYAVTSVGKVLSVFLAAFGMMMFPIFTVYITDKIGRVTNDNSK